jgi:FAD/FMN-containing dehydrogenase
VTIETATRPALPAEFRSNFKGRVVQPADVDFDKLREVALGGIDKRPGLILRPKTTDDVVAAVNYARDGGRELAVRSGGHSGAGHSTTEGGLVIDLRDLKRLDIDVGAKTAWAETGLTAGEVSQAVTEKGLAIGFGDAATVGIGGIVTGGGVGYLSRKHGLTIDSVLAAEVVTADGKVHTVDANHEPDLFWAIRGGGGNFGIVTRFKFKLNPLPAFTGGMMALPATAETIDGFVKAAKEAPVELSTIANIMPAPPMPFLPKEWVGKLIILAMLAYSGDDAAAQDALKPFRALAKPLADFVKPGPYMQMFPPEDPNYKPIATYRNAYLSIRPGIGKTVIDQINAIQGMRVIQIRVLGGAIDKVANDATAYGHRNHEAMAQIVSFYDGTPADKAEKQKWIDGFAAALDTVDGAAYVNFVGDEGAARVRDAYPKATYERLRKIKKQYDPNNLFRLNQNIPPAS